jgi:hypothetical protein
MTRPPPVSKWYGPSPIKSTRGSRHPVMLSDDRPAPGAASAQAPHQRVFASLHTGPVVSSGRPHDVAVIVPSYEETRAVRDSRATRPRALALGFEKGGEA